MSIINKEWEAEKVADVVVVQVPRTWQNRDKCLSCFTAEAWRCLLQGSGHARPGLMSGR